MVHLSILHKFKKYINNKRDGIIIQLSLFFQMNYLFDAKGVLCRLLSSYYLLLYIYENIEYIMFIKVYLIKVLLSSFIYLYLLSNGKVIW